MWFISYNWIWIFIRGDRFKSYFCDFRACSPCLTPLSLFLKKGRGLCYEEEPWEYKNALKGRLRERLKETGRKSKWWKRGSQVRWTVGRMGAGEIISDFMCWNSHSCHKLLNFLRWQMNIFLNFFSWNITLQQDALEKCQEKKTEGGKVLGWEEDKMIYVWTYGGRSLNLLLKPSWPPGWNYFLLDSH